MLRDTQNIPIGILEPGNFVAGRSGPYANFGILDEWIFFKSDATLLEPGRHGFDILNFPTEDGVSRGSEVGNFGNANHVRAGLHDQRKLIEVYELKTEPGFKKSARFIVVLGEKKTDQVAGREHFCLRAEFIGLER